MPTRSPLTSDTTPHDRRWAILVFAALAVLYWRGHCLSFGAGDSPQHVLSALTWGVSRPPGYPLYVLLAHLFSLLPFGEPAGLVNALSGLLHAGTSALFFLILRRWHCSVPAALTAASLMSLSPLYWYYSEVAEVRALNDLLAMGAILLALSGDGLFLGACLGLGLSHHPTYVLILPAIAYWLTTRGFRPKNWAAVAGVAILACVAPYALLWLRLRWGPPLPYNPDDVYTAKDILELFLRRNAGGPASFGAGLPGVTEQALAPLLGLREVVWFSGLAFRDLLPPGIALAGLGLWHLWKTDRRALTFWTLWILGTLLPVVLITSQQVRFGNIDYLRAMILRHYLLPLIGLFALAGFGTQGFLSRSRWKIGWWLVGAAALLPLSLRPIDLGRSEPLRSYAEDILKSSGNRDMILLASDEAIFSMLYMDLVEHRTGDRVFLPPGRFTNKSFIARLQARHPNLKLPRAETGLSRSVSSWMEANSDRPLDAESTLRDQLIRISTACYPQGALLRLGRRFPPAEQSAQQARLFLDQMSSEKVAGWGLRPWTQEVYLLKAYAMMLEFYGPFLRRPQDAELRRRSERAFLSISAVQPPMRLTLNPRASRNFSTSSR